jgi:hypothetical protein
MFHSRLAEATLIGCLTALASFCALNARAGENYSIVAQSTRSSAATGRRPLGERIAAANLPIITATGVSPDATARLTVPRTAATPRTTGTPRTAGMTDADAAMPAENMAVAAVRVDYPDTPPPPPSPAVTPPVLWPFGIKKPAAAQAKSSSSSPRQSTARSSGKGLSSSSPASVTR